MGFSETQHSPGPIGEAILLSEAPLSLSKLLLGLGMGNAARFNGTYLPHGRLAGVFHGHCHRHEGIET
jgi:hypothetical protein